MSLLVSVGQCVVHWLLCQSSFVVRSWFFVSRPWTLVNVFVGQCCSLAMSFVFGFSFWKTVDLGQCRSWSVCCSLVVIRSWFVVGRPWNLVNVVVGQCVVRWLCHLSFIVRCW